MIRIIIGFDRMSTNAYAILPSPHVTHLVIHSSHAAILSIGISMAPLKGPSVCTDPQAQAEVLLTRSIPPPPPDFLWLPPLLKRRILGSAMHIALSSSSSIPVFRAIPSTSLPLRITQLLRSLES